MNVIKLASSGRGSRASLTPMEERVVQLFRAVPEENRPVFLELMETIYRSCDWRVSSTTRPTGEQPGSSPPRTER